MKHGVVEVNPVIDSLKSMIETHGEDRFLETMRGIFGNESTAIAFIHAMRTGFISAPTLTKNAHMSKATAFRAIKTLRDMNVIEFFETYQRSKGRGGGGPRTKIYVAKATNRSLPDNEN